MVARCIGIYALEKCQKIMWGLCLRHQWCYFVGDSGEESTIDEIVLSAPSLISRIQSRRQRRCNGGNYFRRCGQRSIWIFGGIIAIKESFNLEFPIKIISGKKLGDICMSDASKGFRWFIMVGKEWGVIVGHETQRAEWRPSLEKGGDLIVLGWYHI